MKRGWIPAVALLTLLLASCSPLAADPTPMPAPTMLPASNLNRDDYQLIFDTVWQAVNDKYWDPTFGGQDWQAIGDEYHQKLASVHDDKAFWFQVLNPMLFELEASHLVALPAELVSQIEPMIFALASLGMDVRLLDGDAVITRVDKGSPAARARLRPGFVITSLNGQTPADLAAEIPPLPPYNERHERGAAISGLRSALFGTEGQEVIVEYLDAKDRPRRANMLMTPRRGFACGDLDPTMPPACAEIETATLAKGVAYLRFSGFLTGVKDSVLQAIQDVDDVPALIIDLRGNPGGQFPVRKAIASQLDGIPKKFIRYQYREKAETVFLDIVADPYPGQVVILVDELSASSSEEFAGSLQSMGRATIIGTQTPGSCLVANFEPLPKGGVLMYPYGQSQTMDGRILEGNGVLPDIDVALDRASLLDGVDRQLEAALHYLENSSASQ